MRMTTTPASLSIDQLSIDTLRMLALDQVEKANSGHPGAPLGCAPIAYLLFHKLMKHNPAHSKWTDRDRFVLSNGHASALLYGTLHLSGYNLTMDDLKGFRQWHSKTPGHPERGEADGVEVTTGPLGQGFAMGVGLAIAEKHLAAVYNKPGHEVVDHHTYVLCGDGDLMEGVSHEAASLAGTLSLGKLIVLYDDNLISLDGPTEWSFTEDVLMRFEAYHWHTQRVANGNDLNALEAAIEAAKAVTDKPSMIAVRTVIGYGSPKAGTNKVHGEAMSAADTAATKRFFGFPEGQTFYVPDDALKNWRTAVDRGKRAEAEWKQRIDAYAKAYPELAEQFQRADADKRRAGWEKALPSFGMEKKIATRNAGNTVMNAIAGVVPELFGGAADLTASTKTIFKDSAALCRGSRGAQRLLRSARVCHVRGGEWHGGARGIGAVRVDVLHILGLCEASDPAGGLDAGALDFCVYARFDRVGRRRADASAHRAADDAPRGAGFDGLPPSRRQ